MLLAEQCQQDGSPIESTHIDVRLAPQGPLAQLFTSFPAGLYVAGFCSDEDGGQWFVC